jgi:hypothetical protein
MCKKTNAVTIRPYGKQKKLELKKKTKPIKLCEELALKRLPTCHRTDYVMSDRKAATTDVTILANL